jgi:hypothetical protein
MVVQQIELFLICYHATQGAKARTATDSVCIIFDYFNAT